MLAFAHVAVCALGCARVGMHECECTWACNGGCVHTWLLARGCCTLVCLCAYGCAKEGLHTVRCVNLGVQGTNA